MTENEARITVERLVSLRGLLEKSKERVNRSRKYRPSEKAMTMSSYGMDIDAVQNAIDHIVNHFGIRRD